MPLPHLVIEKPLKLFCNLLFICADSSEVTGIYDNGTKLCVQLKELEQNVSSRNKMNPRFVPPYFCVFPGYYCGTPGLTEVSAPCEPGFYCPGGQASSYEYNCTLGTYCPEGTAVPIMCETGTFQDLVGQSQCRNCTGRYYCDPYEFAVGSNDTGIIVPLSCPQGYYCPEGTGARNSYPCLPGTYGGGTELLDSCK